MENKMKYTKRESHLIFFIECLKNFQEYNEQEKALFKNEVITFLKYDELQVFYDDISSLSNKKSKAELLEWWNSGLTKSILKQKLNDEIGNLIDKDIETAKQTLDNFNYIIFCISKLHELEKNPFLKVLESKIDSLKYEIIKLRTELYSEVSSSPIMTVNQALSFFFFDSKKNALNIFKNVMVEIQNRKGDGYKIFYLLPLLDRIKTKLKLDYLPYIDIPSENHDRKLKFSMGITFLELENELFPEGFIDKELKIISKKNIISKKAITSKKDFIDTHILFFNELNPQYCKDKKVSCETIELLYKLMTEYYPSDYDIFNINKARLILRNFFKETHDGSKEFLVFTKFLYDETEILNLKETNSVKKFCEFYSEYFHGIKGFSFDTIKDNIMRKDYAEKKLMKFKKTKLYSKLSKYQ